MEHNDLKREFQEVFEKHSDELFRHCLMRISERERALELTQEAFLRAWEYVSRGEEIRQYRSFLYRTLNNLIVDEYRKQKSQSLDALLESDESGVQLEGILLRDDSDGLEEAMIRFDASRAVAALRQLPDNYRTVITLRYIDGLSPQEIAGHINESENTVSVRIHRGLKKLREMLEQ
ncbi:MAG: RNA polymerase sigma factor [Patescibacteria group bacterium]|nr:RNA polymerase sigma factor [Patescibacteria group bacterium]